MDLQEQLTLFNPHWLQNINVEAYRRRVYYKLETNLSNSFILTLYGPRRTGKTTIMRQLISHLISNNYSATNILFFSFDLYKSEPHDVLQLYSEIMGVDTIKEPIFVFFDEIQYVDNWASKIKIYYDHRKNMKFILSGSSSMAIQRGRESLAGREFEFQVPPLQFSEFLDLKGIKNRNPNFLWSHYLTYMHQQLPELAMKNILASEYIDQIVKKVIYSDIPRLFDVENPEILDSIFRIICRAPGQIIRYSDLGNDLSIHRHTVSKYLFILEESLLIRKIYNFSSNIRKSERKNKRYYPYYTTLHLYTHPYLPEFSMQTETEVAMQLDAEYFYNNKGREIDFIMGYRGQIGIEVKMRNVIEKKDIHWLISFDRLKKRILIVKNHTKINFSNNNDLIIIPLHRIEDLDLHIE